MCMLCVEIQKGMTIKEVARAYFEMIVEPEHQSELLGKLLEHYDAYEVYRELKKLSDGGP